MKIRQRGLLTLILSLILVLTGCASGPYTGTATGAVLGGAAGAYIGNKEYGQQGAYIGGATGALIGGAIGNQSDRNQRYNNGYSYRGQPNYRHPY